MRNYSLKTKANSHHSRDLRALYIKIFLIGIAFFLLFSLRSIIGSVTSVVTVPLFTIRHYFETSSAALPTYIRDRSILEKEIQELKQEIAGQEGLRTTYTYIENENIELRKLLGASTTPSVTAGVIARPPYSPYDTVIIDKGSSDGIVSSSPVYYGSGMALGYVRVVYKNNAFVTLFSSPNVETTVYVFGPNIFTTAYGEGGGVIRLSIPQGIKINQGDMVVLPSLSRGILGKVSSIQSIPTEPEQSAYVRLEVPIQSIRAVRVDTKAQQPVSFEDAFDAVQEIEKTLFTIPIPEDFSAEHQSSTTATSSLETRYE
jgi:cell shape-determining protein MreC